MKSFFQVVTNPPALSGEREREQAIVVTATTTQPLAVTGQIRVKADPEIATGWVIPPRNTSARFPDKGSTQDFAFMLKVPADAPPGTYRLEFQVVDVELMDDHFGVSAPLALVVAPKPNPNGGGNPPRRWWILVAAAALLLGVAFTVWWVFFRAKRMPDLEKRGYATAVADLSVARFRITKVDTLNQDTTTFGRGVVISQSIPPNTKLKSDTNDLRLVVQQSYAVVPAVVGLMADAAGNRLGLDSLLMSVAHKAVTAPAPIPGEGKVLELVPPAGTLVVRGQAVTAIVLTRVPCHRSGLGICIPVPNPVLAIRRDSAATRINQQTLKDWKRPVP
jgi:hypothetical protein